MARLLPFPSFRTFALLAGCLTTVHTAGVAGEPGTLQTSKAVLAAFKDPPAGYRSAPLWVWNDRMTPALIDRDLNDMKAHGIGGAFIHPRPGLITPYLSDEWLALCRHAVNTGKKLGMKIWIYDENSYPSGFAGGIVSQKMPDAKRKGLRMMRADTLARPLAQKPFLVLAKDSSGFADITAQAATAAFGRGDYRIFNVVEEKPKSWHGGFTYVDLMRPEVTRAFIDVTMGAYERVIGDEFGKVVPGVFQDEAEIGPAREDDNPVVNYTPALFSRFLQRYGYDLKPLLPSLYEDTGDFRRVRHDFYGLTLQLFIEGWAKPYYDYCTSRNLKLTGHYWEHEWPWPVMNPDNMATTAYAHMPGIDILMNEFKTDMHAQFGNARAVKEIRSIANQLGRERTLSETFGAGGWEMPFADQKRIADWEYALGVNFMNQHLMYVTLAGARKRDHPLSFSYHEPWWKFYGPLADYYGRLSVALTAGEQQNDILILEPTTTAWMHAAVGQPNPVLDSIGTMFQNFTGTLEAAQVEYDLGSEDILRNHGSVAGKLLTVGLRSYGLVVLPAGMENIEESTVALLRQYAANGGTVLCCGNVPRFVNARANSSMQTLFAENAAACIRLQGETAIAAINRLSPPALLFRDSNGASASFPLLFHHRRTLEDRELLFLANTNTGGQSGQIVARARSCEQWDPFTGVASPHASTADGEGIAINFSLPPGGSLLLSLSSVAGKPVVNTPDTWTEVRPRGATAIRRVAPNVLTLDHCDLTLDGKTEKDLYFYEAQRKAFVHHGLDRNPWDNAVQYRTSILDRDTFAVSTGSEATFHCIMADGVNRSSLRAVVERPEIFRVAVNGTPVKASRKEWWLDRAFGVYDIGSLMKPGDNAITVSSSPFTIHSELEPVYITGDFVLENAARGFQMKRAGTVRAGAWNEQGMPFYADGVSYTGEFELPQGGRNARRSAVRLGEWRGVVADVTVNGRDAGIIAFPPYELDVTKALKPGKNIVTVTVYGSLKNTLGPHHGDPPPGMAWPGSFQKSGGQKPAPGSTYSTVGYGLFEPFALRQVTGLK
jgi:hypothetical protein